MSQTDPWRRRLVVTISSLLLLSLVWMPTAPGVRRALAASQAPDACIPLTAAYQIPAANRINFDTLSAGFNIGTFYQGETGVRFEDSASARVIAYDHPQPRSQPMVAMSDPVGDPPDTVPLNIYFSSGQTHVGMYIGNGGGARAILTAYGGRLGLTFLCSTVIEATPDAHTAFIGVRDSEGRITRVSLWYENSVEAESIDDLLFTTAPPAAHLSAFPAAAKAGSQVQVIGDSFPPAAELGLVLSCPGQANAELGVVLADESGLLSAAVTLPSLPANACTLTARDAERVWASTTLNLLAPLSLTLSPQSGKPGDLIHYSVTGATPGRLRIQADGVVVVADIPVTGASVEGDFRLPGGTVAAAAGDESITVVARNLVNGQVAGEASRVFTRQVAAPVTYQLQNVSFSQSQLTPGEGVTITGKISPPPGGNLSQFQLAALWKDPSGLVFPVGQGGQVQPDGAFQIVAHAPSLLNGSPVSGGSGQIGVIFLHSGGVQETAMPITAPGTPVLKVKVVGPDGQPIPNAVVRVFSGSSTQSSQPSGAEVIDVGVQQLYVAQSQLSQAVGQAANGGSGDPFACQASDLYGRTDAQGIFDPKNINWELMDLLDGKISLGIPNKPGAVIDLPDTVPFPVEVNALFQGYGQVVDGKPAATVKNLVYNRTTNRLYDAATNQLIETNPLLIQLPKLPANVKPSVPIEPEVVGGVKKQGLWLAYGDFLSLAGVSNVTVVGGVNGRLRIEFKSDPQLTGALSNVRFVLDGKELGSFAATTQTGQCEQTTYYFDLNNAYQISPGWHVAQITADTGAGPTAQGFLLKFVNPPAWFLDPSFKNRQANLYSYPAITGLSGSQLPAGGANTAASIGANVPRIGQLDNSGGADDWMSANFDSGGKQSLFYQGGVNAKALNTNAPKKPFSGSGSALAQSLANERWSQPRSLANGQTFSFGEQNITLVSSGWVPLFRNQWGIWPIASATVGADMWFDAHLSYNGTLTVDIGSGKSSSSLLVHPEAQVKVKAWFDLSVLFGVVDAGAAAVPSIAVHVPVQFTNGAKSDGDLCFGYRLDIEWWAKVGVCPLCDEDDGTKNIFNGRIPDPLPALCQKKLAEAANTAVTAPPSAAPALAADPLGHTLAVWSGAGGALVSSAFDGQAWSAAAPIPGSDGGADAQVAFYAPNQAVAAWSAVGLSQSQLASATFSDTVKSQHLLYATWNGSQWSSPAELTPAGSSDGRVALAGCPSSDPVCPAGGAATAVWVRDVAGALGERQFRLFYATFFSGAWSSIQPVDPASTATDSMPAVVYVQGKPVVFWIRDADRSLATLDDRRLVYRVLDGASAVQQPAAFPAGAESPSAAAGGEQVNVAFVVAHDAQALIGNQRTLYSAQTVCPTLANCTWTVKQLIDGHGRAIRGERPALMLDNVGKPVIAFRGLGFGPVPGGGLQAFPGDAPGMVMGTGELAQVDASPTAASFTPIYLTQNGAVNWQPAAAFNPLLNSVVAVAVQGDLPLPAAEMQAAGLDAPLASQQAAAGEPVVFGVAPRLPDFVVNSLQAAIAYPQPGETVQFTATVGNQGSDAGADVQLALVQDGAYGVGETLAAVSVPALAAGASAEITLRATLTGNLNLTHTVTAVVNPTLGVAERDLSNNSASITLGGLPAPTDVTAAVRPSGLPILLAWSGVADERVVGYRVYQAVGDGPFQPIGASPVTGFADLIEAPGSAYRYAVASYAADGSESPLSIPAVVTITSIAAPVEAPFSVYLPQLRK